MHWLPLVAMVIASALPFPHDPVSRIAAATTDPGLEDRRVRLAAPAVDLSFRGNASQSMDFDMAPALGQRTDGQHLHDQKDYVKSSVHEETSTFKVGDQGTHRSSGNSGSGGKSGVSSDVPTKGLAPRTEDISKDEHKAAGSSNRPDYSGFLDFYKKVNVQDSTDRPRQVSTAENHNAGSPVASLKSQRGLAPTAPSDQQSDASTIGKGIQRTPGQEEGLTLEAGLGLGTGLDGILDGDEMFLDAHPRVLFSPSLSPPEHPPLLLMLETGLLDEDRDGGEQEDMDGHIEGHGDRAIEKSATPSWADASAREIARPVRRDKRSHLMDRRRGEKSVCESESVWVTDKKSAIDSHGQMVTILHEIQTQTGPLKQFFYETRCRQPEEPRNTGRSRGPPKSPGMGVAGSGCFGVDKKQWLSECKAKQSFVRALTKDANNRTGWRWIRIDSSCVCVLLSRTNQTPGREVLTKKGRG